MKKLGIDRLNPDERLALLEEIWESLDADKLPLSDVQRIELETRLAEHLADPEAVIPWDEIKKDILPPRG
jgi:putative addiction module component (TIGR02574 family)